MATGPGKYDDVAEHALLTTNAEAVVLIVLNGWTGSGMSVSDHEIVARSPDLARQLPAVLRSVADQIEADL